MYKNMAHVQFSFFFNCQRNKVYYVKIINKCYTWTYTVLNNDKLWKTLWIERNGIYLNKNGWYLT